MKLSEMLEYWPMPEKMSVKEGREWIKKAEQLEVDSELLSDLIKMLCTMQTYITLLDEEGPYAVVAKRSPTIFEQFEGTTPREAIEAAIKKWKDEQK